MAQNLNNNLLKGNKRDVLERFTKVKLRHQPVRGGMGLCNLRKMKFRNFSKPWGGMGFLTLQREEWFKKQRTAARSKKGGEGRNFCRF